MQMMAGQHASGATNLFKQTRLLGFLFFHRFLFPNIDVHGAVNYVQCGPLLQIGQIAARPSDKPTVISRITTLEWEEQESRKEKDACMFSPQ